MKRISLSLIVVLIFSTIAPQIIAVTPQQNIDELNKSKKSLNNAFNSFIKCIKGDKECSPQKTKIIRAVLTLIGLVGLVAIGGTAVYMIRSKKKLPKGLIEAAAYDDLDVITRATHQSSSIINATDNEGNTMLHIAARNGHYKVVGKLLRLGAQQTTNNVGATPLQLALDWQLLLPDKQEQFTKTINLLMPRSQNPQGQ